MSNNNTAASCEHHPLSAAPELDHRLEAVALLERAHATTTDAPRLHQRLSYYELLTHSEQLRLGRMFPELAVALPGKDTPQQLNLAWDARARAYLGRLLDFSRQVGRRSLQPVQALQPDDPAGALVLTFNGSLVLLGPPSEHKQRSFRYEPMRAHEAQGLHARGSLRWTLRVGHTARIGPLQLSRVRFVARGAVAPGLAPLPRPTARLLGASVVRPLPPTSGADQPMDITRYEYLVRLEQLPAVGDHPERQLLECEALGAALHLQQEAGAHQGYGLHQVARFFTDNNTRYEVLPRGDQPGAAFDLARKPAQGRQHLLQRVRVEPQRIVRGAPLAIFTSDAAGEEQISFTGVITRVVLHSGDLA